MNPTILAVESWHHDHPPQRHLHGPFLSIKDDHESDGAAFQPGRAWCAEDIYAPDEPVVEDDPCGGATC